MQNLMPPIESPDNVFRDGDPLTGELGTIVTALFMNNVQAAIRNAQAEIIAIMTDAGIAADAGKSDQLLTALKKTFALNSSPVLTGNPAAPTQPKADNSTKLATTAHVKLVAADYAPLANPALTGTPTAPTAAQTVNSTQIATTAFVKTAIAALVASSPAALDTLDELAAALGDDPNFSTTVLNAIADAKTDATNKLNAHIAAADPHTQYAPKLSPALTGTPTAPTAAQTVNNTQIATTAFVKAAIAALVGSSPAALDTLDELAAALGDDPNFSTTVLNAIAAKLGKTETAASATKLVTARKINGVAFDGTTDVKLDFGLSLKALAQFSTETWIQVSLTAINANTVTMTIDDASRGLYVVPGKTQVVLCENAATTVTVSGTSYTRFNMLGRFAIPSAPTKNADGSTTYTITYPSHGIVVGQQKTIRLGSFVYREHGCTYQGQAK